MGRSLEAPHAGTRAEGGRLAPVACS